MGLNNIDVVNKIVALWVNDGANAAAEAYARVSDELGWSAGKSYTLMGIIEQEVSKCHDKMLKLGVNLGDTVGTPHGPGTLVAIEYYSKLHDGENRYVVRLNNPYHAKETLAYWSNDIHRPEVTV